MSVVRSVTEGVISALIVLACGFLALSIAGRDHIPFRVSIGDMTVSGMHKNDIPDVLRVYEKAIEETIITIHFREAKTARPLKELGVILDREKTAGRIQATAGGFLLFRNVHVQPVITIASPVLHEALEHDFASEIRLPQDPGFTVTSAGKLVFRPGVPGEQIDERAFADSLAISLQQGGAGMVEAHVSSAASRVTDSEMQSLQPYAERLLQEGFRLTYNDEEFRITKAALVPMLRFSGLGGAHVVLDEEKLHEYLTSRIAEEVKTLATDARFEVQDGKVTQFAQAQDGHELDSDATSRAIAQALLEQRTDAQILTSTIHPLVADVEGGVAQDITTLLARGETDFVGSPKNRIHNITVGTALYHGIMVAPGEEFSFLKFLGPVDEEHGFKPELVIKENKTVPEFGGGLCQVSTTLFRAAAQAGMKITERHNHSYAVRYYGTPGFDATIYPPYTDFRFLNNTSHYVLVQTRIEGTKLTFELWGTPDGRSVEIDGPHPYNRKPDGAVKATLKRKVVRDGEAIIEDTFYSNYKSPSLFPHT